MRPVRAAEFSSNVSLTSSDRREAQWCTRPSSQRSINRTEGDPISQPPCPGDRCPSSSSSRSRASLAGSLFAVLRVVA